MYIGREFTDSEKLIRNKIKEILDIEGMQACFIFGSFCTDKFREDSDIDIAILTNLKITEIYSLTNTLEKRIRKKIDLIDVRSLPKIFQLQITHRSDILFCNNDILLDDFYDEVQLWYKTEFRLWKAWQEAEW